MSDDMSVPNAGYRGNRLGRYRRGATRMDPDTRRLMLFAGGVGGVLICLIAASTLIGRHSGTVPVVTADMRPTRVKPDNPGGMRIDGAENDVFSSGADNSNSKLAPAAEMPDPNGMHAPAVTPRLATPDATPPLVTASPPSARSAAVADAAPSESVDAAPAKTPAATVAPASTSPGPAAPTRPASAPAARRQRMLLPADPPWCSSQRSRPSRRPETNGNA